MCIGLNIFSNRLTNAWFAAFNPMNPLQCNYLLIKSKNIQVCVQGFVTLRYCYFVSFSSRKQFTRNGIKCVKCGQHFPICVSNNKLDISPGVTSTHPAATLSLSLSLPLCHVRGNSSLQFHCIFSELVYRKRRQLCRCLCFSQPMMVAGQAGGAANISSLLLG